MTAGSSSSTGEIWGKKDWLIAGFLFAATFLSRVPFRTTLLYAWDSVLYARALSHFDVSIEQPHPPGHIFYVFMARMVNHFVADPNSALVWVSVFFAAAAVLALYWLGRMMFGRPVALLASLLLATSLSFWAYSEVAYPYTLLAFLGITAAGLIYRARESQSAVPALMAALFIGLGSGFRQDLLPFTLPLLAYGLYGMPWRRLAAAAALLFTGILSWYLPTALLSGGISKYEAVNSSQSDYIVQYNSVFGRGLAAITSNLHDVGWFTLVALAAAAPLLLYFLFRLLRPGAADPRHDRRLLFLLVWIVPSLLFFIFMHVGEYGYVFIYLPAALLLSAWGASLLARDLAGRKQELRSSSSVFGAVAAAAVLANLSLFLVLTPTLSANRLAARDGILRSRIDTISRSFNPRTTFIVSVFDYQQASWYLPQYQVWHFDPLVDDKPVTELPAGTEAVLVFEEYLHPGGNEASVNIPIDYDQQLVVMYPGNHRYVAVDWQARTIDFRDEIRNRK